MSVLPIYGKVQTRLLKVKDRHVECRNREVIGWLAGGKEFRQYDDACAYARQNSDKLNIYIA
jgi:hypothetical protein